MFEYQGVKISWLGHDSFRIKNGKTIIIDPFKIRPIPDKADVLLISHEHFDHLSLDDIKKVSSEKTSFNTDIALLPVNGTYVMTPEEAGEATRMIKPKLAIPMHYGTIVGSESDAERFKQLAACPVQILKSE